MDADAYAVLTTPLLDIEFDEMLNEIINADAHNVRSYPYAVDFRLDSDIKTNLRAVAPLASTLSLEIDGAAIDVVQIDVGNPKSLRVPISRDVIAGIVRLNAKTTNSQSTPLLLSEKDVAKIYLTAANVSTSQIVADDITFKANASSRLTCTNSSPLQITSRLNIPFESGDLAFAKPMVIPQCDIECRYKDNILANFNVVKLNNIKNKTFIGTLNLHSHVKSIPMDEVVVDSDIGQLCTDIIVDLAKKSHIGDYNDNVLTDLVGYTLYDMRFFLLNETQGNVTMTNIASRTLQQLQYN